MKVTREAARLHAQDGLAQTLPVPHEVDVQQCACASDPGVTMQVDGLARRRHRIDVVYNGVGL